MSFSSSQLDAAYAHCARAARRHYENFPVASLLLPKGKRRHVAAVYAFARAADDFADEAAFEGRRLELLEDWRRRLRLAAGGEADDPIFVALADTIRSHALPVELLDDLLKAFEQDVRVSAYESFQDLLDYCRLSAVPVGRLVLHLFGRAEEDLLRRSDAVCAGLQLANFWQDVGPDLDRGRCYLPQEDLRRLGCPASDLRERRATPAFVEVMRLQIRRTREMFESGAALPALVGGRLGFELRLVLLGGQRVLERIEKAGCDVFRRRPSLTVPDWTRLLVRAAVAGAP